MKNKIHKHYTCTGNKKLGSRNSKGVQDVYLTDEQLRDEFGYYPRDHLERIIMSERLLAVDNPQRK